MNPEKKEKSSPIIDVNYSHLTGDDLEMIQELDYEEKKKNKPYDPYERHWDEA